MSEVYRFKHYYIPPRMMGAIERYLKHGISPGDFLTAVICNNLSEAVARADDENMDNLPAYAAFFYSEVPGIAWGSRERMQAWQQARQEADDAT